MAAPVLDDEQRLAILTWLAAGYSAPLIVKWFKKNKWPEITASAVRYYRAEYREDIGRARKERHEEAITSGLALKEERVARLCEHADKLEVIKWVPDKNGKLNNEKCWRETLDDIAVEMGHRKQVQEHSGPNGGPIPVTAITLDDWRKQAAERRRQAETAAATKDDA
jgi:hypothetical protein